MITVGFRSFKDIESLEKLVIHLATEYDLGNPCVDFEDTEVSDPEYDELYKSLKKVKPSSKAFEGTSPSTVASTGGIVIHNPPMTSIAKADGDDRLKIYQDWLKDCAKRLGREPEIVQTFKHDGLALRINYVNGVLVSAGLRPRLGVEGSDVTQHVAYIRGVPKKLDLPLTLSLNGEVECLKSDFEKINQKQEENGEDPYKNPRNYTAGRMGKEDAEEIKDSKLSIAFYSITGFDNWQNYYKNEIERAKWANKELGLGGFFVQVRPHRFEDLQKMEDFAKELDYEVDGIILKVSDLEDQEQLGNHGDDPIKEPRGAIAWKFTEETAIAEVKEIEWNASRTGRVVPKAIFVKAINLADTEVSQATCNNVGWAKMMQLGVGAKVEVKKAGKIIPKVIKVLQPSLDDLEVPEKCPTCSEHLDLVISDSGCEDLMCCNPDCGAKHIKSWVFYFQTLGAKGLGEAAMEKILNGGKVKSIADLYELSIGDLLNCGFSSRQAHLALCTIHMVGRVKRCDDELIMDILPAKNTKKKFQAWQFFAALGIPGAGKTSGKILIEAYRSFDKIRQASFEELQVIEGIGPVTAQAIVDYFQEKKEAIDQLLKHVELELPKEGKLTGKNFVLTGSFEQGKSHWEQKIADAGGKCSSSVGSKTHYLLLENGKTDGSPSTKEIAAAEKGIPVISIKELEAML
jgi:DNA ligase (NAD+)